MVRTRAVVVVTVLTATSVLGWWLGQSRHTAVSKPASCGRSTATRSSSASPTVTPTPCACSASTRPRPTIRASRSSATGPRRPPTRRGASPDRVVGLEFDVEARDRYGRRLAYVYLHGSRFNDELIERGLARLLVIEPNVAHSRTMLAEELAARHAGRGLWSAC